MNEPVRMVADWLATPVNGVNAQLVLVPRDGTDPQPANVVIEDETRNAQPARRELPTQKGPIVTVALFQGESDGEIHTAHRDGEVQVLIRVRYQNAQSDEAVRDTGYVHRAIVRSLKRLNDNVNLAARQRNAITLWVCSRIQWVRVQAEAGDSGVTRGIIASYRFRDTDP